MAIPQPYRSRIDSLPVSIRDQLSQEPPSHYPPVDQQLLLPLLYYYGVSPVVSIYVIHVINHLITNLFEYSIYIDLSV